ncbi:glycosyltransferase [Roseospira navarrensis]|uniref:Glycosyltransferase n=1 Tax=Roseospira navarrensis TaxID=140058 RepID=A0A7X1ZF44_9PROT|nr:glycosyltransferase [Roseospira navarrensis]MQX37415.1 glycosyltransferase [Roseospira navarrensis]
MTQRPHLLIASGVWPHVVANREAANVISHEITHELARSGAFRITYAFVGPEVAAIPAAAQTEIEALRALGVEFLEPVIVPATSAGARGPAKRLMCALRGRPERMLTGIDGGPALMRALGDRRPDAALTLWSETATNLVSTLPVPRRFSYAGNPDHKVLDARLDLAERLHGRSALASARNTIRRQITKSAHMRVVRRLDRMWNVAANDAADYRAAGIKAVYLQNMWPAAVRQDWEAERDAREQTAPVKIVGNVGNLFATGNSYGLLTLGCEILPELKRLLGDGGFEIHLFGGGQPHPAVAPHLRDPHIRIRGFVEDLDAEMLSAPVFLVANNSQKFKVGHTRFLHAWSLGAAVVGFGDSREAMPEIEHGRNAMLGETPAEVAGLVADLARDAVLRRMIGRNGAAMLDTVFSPARVARVIADDISSAL